MLLSLSTWQEIESRLENSKGVVVPIGSTEQHGPNGLLGTDALCPEIIASAAHEEGDLLVAPTFNVGSAQHHMGFPGTITLRPSTMVAALRDWIDSFYRAGFNRIFFLNGHGGNIAPIQTAFADIYADWSLRGVACPYRLKFVNWWELPGVPAVCQALFPEGDGLHATASEVSVTYYGYPGSVKNANMSPRIAPVSTFTDAADYRRRFPDGRIGSDPSQASVEKGGEIVRASKNSLIRVVREFFEE